MNNTILNSLNKATSIIANEKSRQEVLGEIDSAIRELNELRRRVAGDSYTAGNGFGGDVGAQYRANYLYEELPE